MGSSPSQRLYLLNIINPAARQAILHSGPGVTGWKDKAGMFTDPWTHTQTLWGKIKQVKRNTLWAAFRRPLGSTVTWIHLLEESRTAIVLTFWWSKGSLTLALSGTVSSQWQRSLVLEAWTGNGKQFVWEWEKKWTHMLLSLGSTD